jgi:hypothetical protein
VGLLKKMATHKVLVEVCLTSNASILGVEGADHPLPTYLKYGVPVTLATDDQGVSRSDMTHEYLRAVQSYGFSYPELKRFARQSLEHSFLAGDSLWTGDFKMAATCAGASGATDKPSAACKKLLDASDKARVQWQLEKAFAEFETKF